MSDNLKQVLELLQNVAGEAADDLYVIEKENYRLLYVNQLKKGFWKDNLQGEKCYQLLYGRSVPCENCRLNSRNPMGEMTYEEQGRFYEMKIRETERTAGAVFSDSGKASSRRNGCGKP